MLYVAVAASVAAVAMSTSALVKNFDIRRYAKKRRLRSMGLVTSCITEYRALAAAVAAAVAAVASSTRTLLREDDQGWLVC